MVTSPASFFMASSGAAPFDPTLIGNSVWLDGTADYFSKTYSGSGNSTTEAIFAFWYQRYSFGVAQSTWFEASGFGGLQTSTSYGGGDILVVNTFDAGGTQVIARHTRLLRDVAWYHIIVSIDMSQTTTLNKIKFYINGEQDTTINVQNLATTNGLDMLGARSRVNFRIGENAGSTGHAYAQYCYLDGVSIQQGDYVVTDFLDTYTLGTNGSQFIPKVNTDIAALATAAGGNSLCLDFSNSADLGNDISSNNNDFTANSMSSVNQSINTPSKYYPKVSNIGTPSGDTAANYTMGKGSNRMVYSGANQTYKGLISTQLIQSDDSPIYWEYYLESGSVGGASGGRVSVGLCVPHFNAGNASGFSGAAGNNPSNLRGVIYDNGSQGATTGSTLIGVGDIQNLAYEPSTGKIWFGVNGTWNNGSEAASTTLNPSGHDYQATVQDYVFFISAARSTDIGVLNFGDNPSMSGNITAGTETDANGHGLFKYAVPSGFFAPVSANLTAPDYQGIDYFDSTLYEGNGTGQRVGDFVPFTDAFNVANSAMFQHDDVRALKRTIGTPSSSGGKKGTWSTWYKTGVIDTDNFFFDTGTTATNRFILQIDIQGNILFYHGSNKVIETKANFMGGGTWHNLVLKVDTELDPGESGATPNRAIMYIDGVQLTSTDFSTSPTNTNLPEDAEIGFMDPGATQFVGSYNGVTANQWDGYLAETIFLDNQFLSADSFGQLDTSTNKWVPKDISGLTLGDQGFYLAYGGNFGTGNGAGDSTGNSNNLTEIGTWATSDQFTDTPSKNYAIFSPKNIGSATATLSEGNLKYTGADNGGFPITLQPTSGKWYFEVELDTLGAYYPGLFTAAGLSYTGASAWAQTSSFVYLTNNASGAVYNGGTVVNGYNTGSMSASDRLGIAWDVDNNFIYYGLASGGSTTFFSSGDPTSGAAGTGAAPFSLPSERLYFGVVSGGAPVSTHHFISSGWIGAAPTGFLELNQDNLDDTASKITAWAWIKNRDSTDSHILVDRVRGVGEVIHSNEDVAEATEPNTVQRFLQRGVQVGSDVQVNTANESYVLWQWLMGDSATTGTVNNDGSIASTLIAADAGHLSIGTYTGTGANATVGHGLGGAPEMIIVKDLDTASTSWPVYHEYAASDAETDNLVLNTTAALFDDATKWNDTAPTSTVFSIGTNSTVNANTKRYFFITFRSVAGVCKVGSYIGNGNADGPYIDLGFKPAFFMAKSTGVENWVMLDNQRPNYNPTGGYLFANLTNVEAGLGSEYTDFLSSGIKLRTTGASANSTGVTYIYLAMADIGGNGTLPPIYGR